MSFREFSAWLWAVDWISCPIREYKDKKGKYNDNIVQRGAVD